MPNGCSTPNPGFLDENAMCKRRLAGNILAKHFCGLWCFWGVCETDASGSSLGSHRDQLQG
jgi:hypothetical protein